MFLSMVTQYQEIFSRNSFFCMNQSTSQRIIREFLLDVHCLVYKIPDYEYVLNHENLWIVKNRQ